MKGRGRVEPNPLVLGRDPGHDDAVALLVASASVVVDLLAVTTVAGNQTVDKTTLDARRVLSAAGLTSVPVAAGAAHPLVRPLRIADDVHGESGLEPNTDVAMELDVERFWELIVSSIARYRTDTIPG